MSWFNQGQALENGLAEPCGASKRPGNEFKQVCVSVTAFVQKRTPNTPLNL